VKNGFSMSATISPITLEVCMRSARAVRLGVYPSSRATCSTWRAFSGDTFDPLKTRDTVAAETPARAATS
jgi:hypothetical protein